MVTLPLEDGDEVVAAARMSRDGANSFPEQILIITRGGQVWSLTWKSVGMKWVYATVEMTAEVKRV